MLIDRLSGCMAGASSDKDHPAVRYGRQLAHLRSKLSGLSVSFDGFDAMSQTETLQSRSLPIESTNISPAPASIPAAGTIPDGLLAMDMAPSAPWAFPDLSAQPPAPEFDFGGLPLPGAGQDIFGNVACFDPALTVEQPDSERSSNGFLEALDLQDFWSQFGPGEVRHVLRRSTTDSQAHGGFPFL